MGSENQVLIILPNNEFQDAEYKALIDALSEASIESKIAAMSMNECIGIGGMRLMPSYTLDDVDSNMFDGVILIGGPGTEDYIHEDLVHQVAKNFLKEKKLVAAICWAPSILAYAGVLRGVEATVWEGARDDLVKNGANYRESPVVISGNIITANGPDAAEKFGQAVARYILELK